MTLTVELYQVLNLKMLKIIQLNHEFQITRVYLNANGPLKYFITFHYLHRIHLLNNRALSEVMSELTMHKAILTASHLLSHQS